ncbi:guanylate kinase [Prochlorococcus sp. AH-716-I09]|nr:guanylate kinase [Prochlorococcus sp. AH-716-I09]
MKNHKKLIILTGPSGVGKGTVVKEILNNDRNIWLSISATTREPREGEKSGENYYFLNQEKFKEMIEKNLFLEWAQFAGNYYGTPFYSVNEKIKKGFTVLLEIEVEGAKQIKEKFPESLSIFLLPPNKEELERRIRNRATESEEAIKKRLLRANYEISVSNQFDYALINHNVDETAMRIIKLIKTTNYSQA